MLYTGIGLKSLQVLRLYLSTKLQLIKTLVVSKLTSIYTKDNLKVTVVLRNMGRYKEY